ncbi:MAG: AAA family ATPase [Chloroflexi bacterium]|nr:AAA family ATPase [Chloroflexota bacterium]
MRIKGLWIDGYGIYSRFGLPELSPRFVVFHGRNEAGKSTLLWFIRQVLFGFPSGNTREPRYPPLRGGRPGGWLDLVDARGDEYRVERRQGKGRGDLAVQRSDGTVCSEGELARLLNGLQADDFNAVFAFTLTELAGLEKSFRSELQVRVYEAGVTGGRAGLLDATTRLDTEARELMSARAGVIRDSAHRLRDLETGLAQAQRPVREYDDLVGREAALLSDFAQDQEALEDLRHRHVYLENARKVWNVWLALTEAERKLETLPVVEGFPENGVARLEHLLDRRNNRQEELARLDAQAQALEGRIASSQVDALLLQEAARVDALYRTVEHYVSARKDLPDLQAELRAAEKAVQGTLANLGAGWDEARGRSFDSSVAVHQAVRSHKEAIQGSNTAVASLQSGVTSRQDEAARAGEIVERRRKDVERAEVPETRELASAQAKVQAATDLARALRHLESADSDRRHLEARKSDLIRQRDLAATPPVSIPGRLAAAVVVAFLALATALALLGQAAGAAVSAVAAVFITLAFLYLRDRQRRDLARQGVRSDLEQAVSSTQAELAGVERAAQGLRQATGGLVEALQLPSAPDTNAAEALVGRATVDVQNLRRWNDLQDGLEEAEATVKSAQGRLKDSQQALGQALEQQKAAGEAWLHWLAQHGLPADLEPDTVLEVCRLVQFLREQVGGRESLQERLRRVTERLGAFESGLTSILVALGRGPALGEGPAVTGERLKGDLDRARHAQSQLETLVGQLETVRKDQGTVGGLLARCDREIEELLAAGQAPDEETFRHRASLAEQRASLSADIEGCRLAMEAVSGPGEAYQKLQGFLSTRQLSDIDTETEQVSTGLREGGDQQQSRQEELAVLRAQISAREQQTEMSAMRLEYQTVRERLAGAVARWAVLSICLSILQEARGDYEREHQPEVIKAAAGYFAGITEGRYPRLLVPAGEQRLLVESGTGEQKAVGQLSRATAEQLYLAMRLGLVTHMSKSGEPLPVIMDDVLVNFDPERSRKTCEAFVQVSRRHQVLVFTCHPETVEAVRQASGGDFQLVQLP